MSTKGIGCEGEACGSSTSPAPEPKTGPTFPFGIITASTAWAMATASGLGREGTPTVTRLEKSASHFEGAATEREDQWWEYPGEKASSSRMELDRGLGIYQGPKSACVP